MLMGSMRFTLPTLTTTWPGQELIPSPMLSSLCFHIKGSTIFQGNLAGMFEFRQRLLLTSGDPGLNQPNLCVK